MFRAMFMVASIFLLSLTGAGRTSCHGTRKLFATTMLRAGQEFPHDSVVVPKFFEKTSKAPRKNNALYVKYRTMELRVELSPAD